MITLLFHQIDDEILSSLKDFLLMFSLEIVLLGLALAIDAAVVTFAIGLIHQNETQALKTKRGLLVALAFGVAQTLMLWLGSYAGYLLTFSNFGFYFQVGIGVIFLGLALKFVQESMSLEEKRIEWGIIPVIILAFATSIDAFASGISLGTLPKAYLAAADVGIITFSVCGVFYILSQYVKNIPDRWLLRFAAFIFLFLGGQVFWSIKHIFFRGSL
jgi:putative Mn2+ efflux pump MntP